MKTSEFLDLVLPDEGSFFYAATWVPKPEYKKKGFFNHTVCNRDEVAAVSRSISRDGTDAYFALASYNEEGYYDSEGKWRQRTYDNAGFAKSLWLDIDCGAEKAYPRQKDAVIAVKKFTDDCGLPFPNIVVSSGNGIHVYWTFTKSVPRDIWIAAARRIKALSIHQGLLADPTRTADIASVLRPIGTNNWKDRTNPKEVKIVGRVGSPLRFSEMARQLNAVCASLNVDMNSQPRAAFSGVSLNSDLQKKQHPPSNAYTLAQKCAVIADMRDTLGKNQNEPLWYKCLGVLAFTEQGDDICHEWSSGHVDYDAASCQSKLEQRRYSAGPTSCAAMKESASQCASCTQNCKYPIVLGYPEPVSVTEIIATGEIIPPLLDGMEKNFIFDPERGGLCKRVEDKEANKTYWIPICTQLPIIDYIFRDPEGEHYARLRVRTRANTWEESEIKVSVLTQGGPALMGALGGRVGITVKDSKGVTEFMQTWFDKLRSSTELQVMRRQFGWQDDGSFLLGNQKFDPDGTVSRCTVSKDLQNYIEGHVPQGDLNTNVEMLDKLYNRPGYEPYQFVIAASLGSSLLDLVHNGSIGVPIALWEHRGGRGKSTVCQAAISLWGNSRANAQTANADNATDLALFTMAGLRRNLPVLIDETTMWDSERIAKFAYSYSHGVAKMQAKAEGGLRDNSIKNWTNFLFTTSNRSLVSTMAAEYPNSGPQIARVFEIHMPDFELRATDRPLLNELWNHYGLIGSEFIRHVVMNKDKVRKMIEKIIFQLQTEVDSSTDARFWVLTAACTIAAAAIAKKYGLLTFDPAKLASWTRDQLNILRQVAVENIEDTSSMVSRLFSDTMKATIVTNTMGTTKEKAQIDRDFHFNQNEAPSARYIMDSGDLYITIGAIRKWCKNNTIDYRALREALTKEGWLIDHACKFCLTVHMRWGVKAQARCWVIRSNVIAERVVTEKTIGPRKVVSMFTPVDDVVVDETPAEAVV